MREAEILLSKNLTFSIGLQQGRQVITCDGVSKWLPSHVQWTDSVEKEASSGIPYITTVDGNEATFCVEFFQGQQPQSSTIPDIHKKRSTAAVTAGAQPLRGQQVNPAAPKQPLSPGKGELVCACGEARATCDVCHKGYLQEVRRGRVPQLRQQTQAVAPAGPPPPLPQTFSARRLPVPAETPPPEPIPMEPAPPLGSWTKCMKPPPSRSVKPPPSSSSDEEVQEEIQHQAGWAPNLSSLEPPGPVRGPVWRPGDPFPPPPGGSQGLF